MGSAHLTIGILAVVWQRALRAALEAAVADGAWRASIVPGTVPAPHDVARSLEPHLEQPAVRRWMVKEVWRRQPATRLRARHQPSVTPSTPLQLTPGPLLWLERVAGRAVLGLGDRELSMPGEAHGVPGRTARGARSVDDCGCRRRSRRFVQARRRPAPRCRRGGRTWLSSNAPPPHENDQSPSRRRPRKSRRGSSSRSSVPGARTPSARASSARSRRTSGGTLMRRQGIRVITIRRDRRAPARSITDRCASCTWSPRGLAGMPARVIAA